MKETFVNYQEDPAHLMAIGSWHNRSKGPRALATAGRRTQVLLRYGLDRDKAP